MPKVFRRIRPTNTGRTKTSNYYFWLCQNGKKRLIPTKTSNYNEARKIAKEWWDRAQLGHPGVSKDEVIAKLVENILNRKFIHFGKPDSQMFMYAYNQLLSEGDYTKNEILMVGDTLQTDILGGNKFGLQTVLVLSGNTRESAVDTLVSATGIIPDYICRSIVH